MGGRARDSLHEKSDVITFFVKFTVAWLAWVELLIMTHPPKLEWLGQRF